MFQIHRQILLDEDTATGYLATHTGELLLVQFG
jgi:hypothetical protein